jgi:putative inorganic carbon (HCO3(-)) transporter
MGLYILVYGLITQMVRTKHEGELVVIAILASAAVVCVWGLVQYNAGMDVTAERWVDGDQFPELKKRVFSTLGNPNVLAAFLVLVVGLAAGWSLDAHEPKRKAALVVVTTLSIVCILLTYSRGAWLSVGVMALVMAAVWRHWNRRVLLAVTVVVAIVLAASHEAFMARLLSIKGMFNPEDSSVALRWALWESTLAMINEYPWSGLGWGTYRFVYPEYDFFVQNESVIIYHAHNTLLSLAAETGIPGVLCFAAAWAMGALRALLIMKHVPRAAKGFYLGIALALLGMAAFSLTDHVLFNIQVTAVFWALLALAVSLPAKGQYEGKHMWFYKKFCGVAGVLRPRENIKNI